MVKYGDLISRKALEEEAITLYRRDDNSGIIFRNMVISLSDVGMAPTVSDYTAIMSILSNREHVLESEWTNTDGTKSGKSIRLSCGADSISLNFDEFGNYEGISE